MSTRVPKSNQHMTLPPLGATTLLLDGDPDLLLYISAALTRSDQNTTSGRVQPSTVKMLPRTLTMVKKDVCKKTYIIMLQVLLTCTFLHPSSASRTRKKKNHNSRPGKNRK